MKKLLAFALPALFVLSFSACGPSEAEEKQEKDSVSKDMRSAEERMIDSMNREAAKADSLAKIAAKADSVRKADSAKAASGKK
ncbi:MAG: hypothetical protein MUC87_16020 [Bacteroidia bacterium]|jgi:hypothetical protein|nr:hypothetical protein [Bacteroidia bacterium]